MRIFKIKHFDNWASKVGLSDHDLMEAIDDIANGVYEANLGGCIYKKRVALKGMGKRGGARVMIAFKLYDKAFFIYGFLKNERTNITQKELSALKKLAKLYLNFNSKQIMSAIEANELIEVKQ